MVCLVWVDMLYGLFCMGEYGLFGMGGYGLLGMGGYGLCVWIWSVRYGWIYCMVCFVWVDMVCVCGYGLCVWIWSVCVDMVCVCGYLY